jgi:predicted phosphodiesterase
VISDTHGLLRPEALAALQGSALIVHAGDIGDPAVLGKLRSIAPQDLDLDPKAAGIDVVISGHSHRPAVEGRRGVLFLRLRTL